MKNIFRTIATRISVWTGSATVFLGAVLVICIWAFSGPAFHYSDTWQLVINTSTTIITFLMVFLIQNTQNRDGKAVQIKLDELIRATKGARNSYVGLEDLSDEDLDELDREFKTLTQNRSTINAMKRLHEKIALEHERRHGPLGLLHRGDTNNPAKK
ncbi:MAG TPA: low affinity iron permease family protein [Candidatus Saccharimonadales bacterium]|nr:low affinity iron permease family protein [Candidatus Saccharimonadales bacterium]